GARLSACLVDHFGSEICQDVVIFGLLLLAILAVGIVGRATTGATRQGRRRPSGRQRASSRAREATERVARACLKHPALAPLLARVRVVAEGVAPLCTRGWLAPYVEVEARLVLSLEEEELTAALLHEAEHLRARDPLLQLFAQVALSLNPLGRWLAPEYARYHLTREALCDR